MTHHKKQMALDLCANLSKTYDSFKKVQSKQMHEEKLTTPQFGVLEILYRLGPMPLNKICIEMMVTGANITCVVDNLEKAGFVERINSKDDRRVIDVALTTSGKKKIQSIMPKYCDNISIFVSVLSGDEQKELLNLLDKLLA